MPTLNIDQQYLELVNRILTDGKIKPNRTGTPAYTLVHAMLQHDMAEGFPLLTTKKVPFKIMAVELEGFLKGIRDKSWYQNRNCHIWDEWCSPKKVPYSTDPETKQKMLAEKDLGPIYGVQWRDFNGAGFDQVQTILDTIRKDPYDRRMVCSAWNPQQIPEMALPPCHVLWHVTMLDERLNLCWFQRSCDTMLGIPFNIASYALLLTLICKETGYKPGILSGFLSDVHIYQNHVDGAKLQLTRTPRALPQIEFSKFESIFKWEASDCKILNYNPHDTIKFEIAV